VQVMHGIISHIAYIGGFLLTEVILSAPVCLHATSICFPTLCTRKEDTVSGQWMQLILERIMSYDRHCVTCVHQSAVSITANDTEINMRA
jgi:hypothetical protein